jgi:hypothetical protein
MIDPAVLRQQVEFLEVQLQDSKQRELDLQRMYDSLLLSLDQDSEEVLVMQTKAVEELKQTQIQVEIQHNDALARLSAQLVAYEKQLRTLKEQLEDSDYKQRTQKLGYEESMMEIRQEALKLKSEKHQLELKLRMQESGEVQSRDQINKSQQMRLDTQSKEIERLKEECEQEVQAVRQQTDAALIELRQIYEKEKKSLEAQLRKAQQAVCKMREELDQEAKASEARAGLEKEIAVLRGARQEAEDKARRCEDELHKALMKLRSKIVPELHGKCPRTPLAKTRLASEPASSGPEEVKRLRCQLTTCRSIIASLENAEKRSKETVLQAQEEVERLQRVIRSKAHEDQENKGAVSSTKLQERLSSLLIQKDIEIGSLKRQIGEMKGAMHHKSAMKPPAYSPKGHHSRSMSYQRDFVDSSAMYTLGGTTTPEKQMAKDRYEPDFGSLEEIQVADSMYRVDCNDSRNTPFTQQSTLLREEASSDWSRAFRDLEQKTREQSLAIKELQVERDRASLDAEKLLIQLKHVKLEWAIEAEGYSEREMALKMQLKQLGGQAKPEKTCRVVSRHGRSQSVQNSPR